MKFWEAFFSTDKFIYPIISTIVFGALIKLISLLANKDLSDTLIIIFMLIGFILGNCLKVQKINEMNQKNYNKKTTRTKIKN